MLYYVSFSLNVFAILYYVLFSLILEFMPYYVWPLIHSIEV